MRWSYRVKYCIIINKHTILTSYLPSQEELFRLKIIEAVLRKRFCNDIPIFFKYIVIDLNDVPLNINAMQKAERNMVGLDCLHEFVIIAVAKCIRKEDNPFCL